LSGGDMLPVVAVRRRETLALRYGAPIPPGSDAETQAAAIPRARAFHRRRPRSVALAIRHYRAAIILT